MIYNQKIRLNNTINTYYEKNTQHSQNKTQAQYTPTLAYQQGQQNSVFCQHTAIYEHRLQKCLRFYTTLILNRNYTHLQDRQKSNRIMWAKAALLRRNCFPQF